MAISGAAPHGIPWQSERLSERLSGRRLGEGERRRRGDGERRRGERRLGEGERWRERRLGKGERWGERRLGKGERWGERRLGEGERRPRGDGERRRGGGERRLGDGECLVRDRWRREDVERCPSRDAVEREREWEREGDRERECERLTLLACEGISKKAIKSLEKVEKRIFCKKFRRQKRVVRRT